MRTKLNWDLIHLKGNFFRVDFNKDVKSNDKVIRLIQEETVLNQVSQLMIGDMFA